MEALKTLTRFIDKINEWVGRGVGWVTLGLVLVVFIDVVMRYLFNSSYVFTQELEWHLFGFIFLIGAGYTLHLCGVLLFLIPGCLMVITTSWKFTANSFAIFEGSPDPGGIPLRFLIKGCIPVGFSLLLLQGFSLGIHSLMQLLGIEQPEEEES
jgi:TRAP-type mannitol/chloroaromatic compound transport system permease small subunit